VSQPHRGPDQQSASEQREHRPHKDRRSTFHRYALPPRVPRVGRLAPSGSGPEAGARTCGERRADGTPTDRSDRSGVGYPAARPRAVDHASPCTRLWPTIRRQSAGLAQRASLAVMPPDRRAPPAPRPADFVPDELLPQLSEGPAAHGDPPPLPQGRGRHPQPRPPHASRSCG
jgi:hypothetical protein